MKPIQILMPMGGVGQRFQDEGYSKPKPLIEVEGQPMFLKALGSFDVYEGNKEHIFVVRKDAEESYGLASSIKELLPDAQITELTEDTRGAVETCLLARDFINPDLPLIIMDCDFSFTSPDYFQKVSRLVQDNLYDGILLSFNSDWDRYSYARLDEAGMVIETAEKQVISNNALAGAYCFGSGQLFLEAADNLLEVPISKNMKEYYISLLFNELVKQGKKIALAQVEQFNSFGTPHELEQYLKAR